MDFDVHIADSVSEDLLDIIRCKYWFIDLSLYLLHVNNGDGKELVKAVKSYAFFREKSEEADYCRSLIEFSADNLRNGPTFYSILAHLNTWTIPILKVVVRLACLMKPHYKG